VVATGVVASTGWGGKTRLELTYLFSFTALLLRPFLFIAFALRLLVSRDLGAMSAPSLPPRRQRHHRAQQGKNQHVAAAEDEEEKR